MPAPTNTTLLEVVNWVATSVGHPTTTDVAATTDEAIRRMLYYANAAGQGLQNLSWENLNKTATISIFADFPGQNEKGFALPADFNKMVDDTHWDRSTLLPAIGPVNSQDWQWLVVRQAMITTRFMWRLRQGQLFVKSPPNTPADFTFEYQSKNWAMNATTSLPQDFLLNNGD